MFSIKSQPTQIIKSVSFGVYSKEEILKLSVLEITNPQSFNALGHSCPGGLYDKALGPVDRNELCATCNENYVRCSGHIGHIHLPLPVVNPFFRRILFHLLRTCCFSCHKLLATVSMLTLLHYKLLALDHGKLNLVDEMEEAVSDLLKEQTIDLESALREKLQVIAKDLVKNENDEANTCEVKNVLECRQRVLKNFQKEHLQYKVRKCPHCGAMKRPIYNVNNTQFILSKTPGKKNKTITTAVKRPLDETTFEAEPIIMDEEQDAAQKESIIESNQTIITPMVARDHMLKLWENESFILKRMYPILNDPIYQSPMDIFFVDMVPVPPNRFRPINRMGDKSFENPQSVLLSKLVQMCRVVRCILKLIRDPKETEPDDLKMYIEKIYGQTKSEKLQTSWLNLQMMINNILDNDPNAVNGDKTGVGVKQIIEKKEGLFRMNMMGKRVNYAARSVISPDPFINIDEIGIPEIFAKRLTFPQPVTPWNVTELRQLVINGPDVYPGANFVRNPDDSMILLTKSLEQRESIAKQLLTPGLGKGIKPPKVVYRHLKNGDMLLLNRQPTLHKPSIMAHKARILKGHKTLRLHYSNCKTYNADFDGDEMNVHFPQSELAKSEAKFIANVNNQYLVPKDGTPLGGLIQDHMISSVHLTMRGRFFTRDVYQQLVFSALPVDFSNEVKLLPPAIMKAHRPRVWLWSGKQIISTILINLIPDDKPRITLESTAKIAAKSWQREEPRTWKAGGTPLKDPVMSDSEVVIRNGEWLVGVLDKAHCGPTPYGLIHCCYEVYGGDVSSSILSAFGRLFTCYMQRIGFSLGAQDILVERKADKKRMKAVRKAEELGFQAAAEAFSVKDPNDHEEIKRKYEEAHRDPEEIGLKALDMCMKMRTDEISNDVNKVLMPVGLLKKFPENNLQLMVLSGAKGATVNTMQISCMLGQIELEGRRPPITVAGRTLPSFMPYDVSPRAGGFIAGRFVTGIRPQEYFFHCMAGREGLTDTAVKTSRSGYLQRCLIKHLEGLVVNYDLTVRDSDGSVVQFLYGEDGLDVQKATFLNKDQMTFWARNCKILHNPREIEILSKYSNSEKIAKYKKTIAKWKKNHPDPSVRHSAFLDFAQNFNDVSRNQLVSKWSNLKEEDRAKYYKSAKRCPDPVVSKFSCGQHLGSVVEFVDSIIDQYLKKNPDNLLTYEESAIETNKKKKKKHKKAKNSKVNSETFEQTIYLKALHSICQPGEAVGLLAAQSIGEPSTQMTLNTFHFAGRGEMNVTLGIPRMREILMLASEQIATPSMEIPFLQESAGKADEMKLKMSKVYMNQVLRQVKVSDSLVVTPDCRQRIYEIYIEFLPYRNYRSLYYVTPAKILACVERSFVRKMLLMLERKCAIAKETKMVATAKSSNKNSEQKDDEEPEVKTTTGGDGGESSDDERRGGDDGDAVDAKMQARHDQDREYEEPEEEEIMRVDEQQSENEEFDEGYETVKGMDESSMDVDSAIEIKESFEKVKKKKRRESDEQLAKKKLQRINYVTNLHSSISDYDFDVKKEQWCKITFKMQLQNSKVDINSIVAEISEKLVIHEVPHIRRAFIGENNGKKILTTEGVNMLHMFQHNTIFDLNRMYCNNIHEMAKTYGIEAARSTIVKEIQNVFKVYGIQVDPRHLLLIADYMTFDGSYKPLNRYGMQSSPSPLQQMSFETTMQFLQSATLAAREDQLKSPSAQIVMGNNVRVGTGCFDLLCQTK